MNQSVPSKEDASEVILVQFVQELAEATDHSSIVAKYRAAYPVLADQFPAMADMMKKVEGSSPEAGTDLPPYLGGFRLIRRIAYGGMGEVFEALEERLQRRVAVKIVRRHHLSPVLRARFLREQLVLARLHQTHIVPIFAAGEEGPLQYFAMPYIEGAALHHALEVARQPRTTWPAGETPDLSTLAEMYTASTGQSGPTTAPCLRAPSAPATAAAPAIRRRLSCSYCRSVAAVMADVAGALHHAHSAGIVHRDVKPSNIMIAPDDKSWVIDFGLAGFRNSPGKNGGTQDLAAVTSNPIAATGVMGTPQYMAPEQWTDPEKVDARADVWGLGATLYELLTLQPAFTGASDAEVRTKVLSTSPVPPKRQVRGLSADLDAICLKALQKQPAQRYPTAQDFAEDLRCWLRDEPPSVVRARRWRQLGTWVRRNKGWAAALGVLLLAMVGALVGWGVLETTRANAADREATLTRAEADEARRSILLVELQQTRLSDRKAGWSRKALDRAGKAARIHVDDSLRNQAAATLAGLDARLIKRLPHGASAIAWDSEGKRLLMGAVKTGTASLWDSARGEEIQFEQSGEGPVAFLADGMPVQLVADPQDRWSVALWDLGHGRQIQQFRIPPGGRAVVARPLNPVILAMAGGGAVVAAATTEVDEQEQVLHGHLAAWESRTGKILMKAEAKSTALALSLDGTVLAAGDADGRVRFWSLPEGKELEPLRSGRTAIHCLALGRNPGRAEAGHADEPTAFWLLATGEKGGAVAVWDLRTRQVKSHCRGSAWDVYTVAFSPDGMTLASAGKGNSRLWDVASGQLLLTGWGLDQATSVAFSPNGRLLAVSSDQPDPSRSDVQVYEVESGRGMKLLRGLVGQVAHVRLSPDGRWLAAVSHNWQMAVWDLQLDRLLHVFDVPIGFFADSADLCFSPNGGRCAFVAGKQAKMWEVESRRELGSWDLPPGLTDRLAFRSEDELVLFRMETEDGKPPLNEVLWREHPRVCRIRHLSPKQNKMITEIKEFNKYVYAAAISPDARYIVGDGVGGPAGDRPSVRIYDGTTGQELRTLPLSNRDQHGYVCMDAVGKMLAYLPSNGDQVTLVDLPNGTVNGVLPRGSKGLGPGVNYWVSSLPGPGMTLVRRQDGQPLLMVAIESEASVDGTFSVDGTRWAWGHTDGSVTVCDLPAVQRHLAEIGLGW